MELAYTEVMASREYEVVLTPEEEGGYSVTVPALPGCISQGATRQEALAMIRRRSSSTLNRSRRTATRFRSDQIERVTVSA